MGTRDGVTAPYAGRTRPAGVAHRRVAGWASLIWEPSC